MTWWLLNKWEERHNYEIIVVFANTGKEREETLEFVRDCDLYFKFNTVWVEGITNPANNYGMLAKVVTFETAARKGEPFEAIIKKHGLPNSNSPHCSSHLKKETIRAYARSIGWKKKDYFTAIGYRYDEEERLNINTKKRERLIWPFVDFVKVFKSDVNKFWSLQSFDLKLKSFEGNCDLCWKKSDRKILTIIKNDPSSVDWCIEMEQKYENYIPPFREQSNIKLPLRMYRKNRSIFELIEMAKQPFEEAIDESKEIDLFKAMGFWDTELDLTGGCEESCEAF
jgi:hypothetical protein